MRAANPSVAAVRYRSGVTAPDYTALPAAVRACAERDPAGRLLVTRPGYAASGQVLMDTTCAAWRDYVVQTAVDDVRAGYNAPYLDVQPHLVGGALSCPSIWVAQGTTGPAAYPAGGAATWAAQCAARLTLRDAVAAATGHHVLVNAYVWAASAVLDRDRETVEGWHPSSDLTAWIAYLHDGPKDAWDKYDRTETPWAVFLAGQDGDDLYAAGHRANPMPAVGTATGPLTATGLGTLARPYGAVTVNVNPTGQPVTWIPRLRYLDVLTGELVGGGAPYTLAANAGTVLKLVTP